MLYRIALAISFALIIAGCSGGHDFEGKFNLKLTPYTPETVVTIGPDFIEKQGTRKELSIFVRESQGEEYLVMQQEDGQEEAWKIVDENALIRGEGATEASLTRVED
jgi:hypothetical protein